MRETFTFRLIRYFREWISHEMQTGWSEEIERYAARIEVEDSPAERDRQFRANIKFIWRTTAIASPIAVVVFVGFLAFIYWCADSEGLTEIPSWTGSPILDFALISAVAIPGMAVSLTAAYWMEAWTSRR